MNGGEMRWRTLSRRSLGVTAVTSLPIALGAVFGLARLLGGLDVPPAGVAAACAGAAVLVVAAWVAYDMLRLRATRWRLTPERLELRSGITTRTHLAVPRDRVRSVDLRADPVRRLFGLTAVKVGTGEQAGDEPEPVLDPLTRHDAEALRRALLRDGAPSVPDDGPLAELRWSWIRYAPLSVWTFTGAAVLLASLFKVFDSFGLKSVTTRLARELWEWIAAQPLVAVPLLLAVDVAVGVVGAMLLFAESWGRYRLDRGPGGLRLRRGLLTTRSLTLEERRLRGVELHEPLLLRLAGAARVKTIATGLGKSGDKDVEDSAALTPPLPRPAALRIATTVATPAPPAHPPGGDGSPPGHPRPAPGAAHPGGLERPGSAAVPGAAAVESVSPRARAATATAQGAATAAPDAATAAGVAESDLARALVAPVRHPVAALRRRVVRALVATGVAAVLSAGAAMAVRAGTVPWVEGLISEGWAVAAVAVPVVVSAYGMWLAVTGAASLGHALTARHLITRRGAVVRRTVALDRRGVAGWTFTETFFQRRSGLLTVSAATAAGRGHYEVVDVGRSDGLGLAAATVPGLLDPFLVHEGSQGR